MPIDNAIALRVKPFELDIATPLMQAAKMQQFQMQQQRAAEAQQEHRANQAREAAGQWARGVAVYADSPEFPQRWAEGMDQLHSRGLMPTQAYQQYRNTPSPLMLQQIIAQTQTPEMAFRSQEAQRAQANADRSFGLQQSTSERDFALRERELKAKHAMEPWMPTPEGGLAPRPGGSADPAYQAKLTEGKDKTDEQIAAREKAVRARGMDVNEPNNRSFILTGRMPREDQQPLTATDKKAILEADEMVLANESAITALTSAKDLSPKAYFGPTAGLRGTATGLVGNEAGQATTELNNLVMSTALGQLKSTFGAAPTEGERKILLEIQGSVDKPDAVRQKIYDRAIELAKKRLEFNRQRAAEMRGGTFYKSQGAAAPVSSAAPPANSAVPAGGVVKWEIGPDGNPRPVK